MKCRRAKTLIFDFVDGMITDQDRLGLEQHLASCGSCDDMASSLARSLDLLHRVEPQELDENFNWKVRLRLAREKAAIPDTGGERVWIRSWNRRFAMSAAAAFVTIVAAGYFFAKSPGALDRFSRSDMALGTESRETATPVDEVGEGTVAKNEPQNAPARRNGFPANGSGIMPKVVSNNGNDEGGTPPGLIGEELPPTLIQNPETFEYIYGLQQKIKVLHAQLAECQAGKK